MSKIKNRIKTLDSLRGIAALAVVLFHYTYNYRQDFSLEIDAKYDFLYGHYGVELFFVISGFVIFMSIDRVKNLKEFIIRRFIRLYPVYWFCLTISLLVLYLFKLPGREVDGVTAFANYSMVQSLIGFKNAEGSYWSLAIEICFYAIIAFWYLVLKIKDKILLFSIGWLILTVADNFIFSVPGGNLLCLNHGYSLLFVIGIMFYKIFEKSDITRWYHLVIVISTLLLVYIQSISRIGFQYNENVIFIIIGLFYLFVYNKLSFINSRVTAFLGRISYVLYLIHMNIGYIIMYNFNDYFNSPIMLLVPLGVVVILSWIITECFDVPVNRLLRKWMLK